MGGFLGQTDARVVALCDVAKAEPGNGLTQVSQKYQDTGLQDLLGYRELWREKTSTRS